MLIRASRGPPGGSSGASRGPPGGLPGACRGRPGGVLEKLHCALTKTHCSGPLRTPPGPSGRPPRGSRLPPGGPLEAAWAPLGRPRGPPGGYLERFQIVFNRLQAVLGRLEAPLALQCRQSTKVAYVCHFRPFPRPPGRLPGASRGPPGGLPGASRGRPAGSPQQSSALRTPAGGLPSFQGRVHCNNGKFPAPPGPKAAENVRKRVVLGGGEK